MNSNILKLFFPLFVFSMSVFSQPKQPIISEVEIWGSSNFSEKEIRGHLSLQEKVFSHQLLFSSAQNVCEFYRDNNYPYARVDSIAFEISKDSLNADVSIFLTENKRVLMGDVSLEKINPEQSLKIKSRFDTKPGNPIDVDRLVNDFDDAITQLEKQGYPFARFNLQSVSIDSLDEQTEQFNFSWTVALGPQLIIDEIKVMGNELTKEHVITREFRIKPGQVFNKSKVDNIQPKLIKLGFFKEVSEPSVYLSQQNRGGLLINVKEGNSSKFDGVLGYNPGTDLEPGYFTGLVDISVGNLLGTGRSFAVKWNKRDKSSQDLNFAYREPWVAGFPVHAGFGFSQLIQDTTYIERTVGFDFELPLLDNLSIISNVQQNSILPDSLASYSLGLIQTRELRASIGVRYDTRDDLINPLSGLFYQTSVEQGEKKNLGPADLIGNLDKKISNQRLTLDLEWYANPFKRQVTAITFHGKQLKSGDEYIPLPELFRLGGTKSLRGFKEDQFRGSTIAWSNLEYRYIMGRRSRAFIFMDVGYYHAQTTTGVNEATKIGYGLGFRLETGLGVMGIDYGLGYGEGDGLFSGKVHIGVVNEF